MNRLPMAMALVCALALPARATDCPQHFQDGTPPAVVQTGTTELCNEAYAVLWDPATRDPVYAAEHLTAAGLIAADKTARLNAFHADVRLLAKGQRAELGDYAGGPFDRGHLAPAHDMPTPEAMRESFALSNMAPQVPAANRGQWAKVEEFTRRLVILGKSAYVVTLLAFDDQPPMLNGRVAVPSAYIKVVYVEPNPFAPNGQVGAYVLANANDAEPAIISLNDVRTLTGIDPMPALSAADHARIDLPMVAQR